MNLIKKALLTIITLTSLTACTTFPDASNHPADPLVIQEQGSFAAGGKIVSTPGTYNNNNPTSEGQTFHGDHLYAFYQVPQNPKPLPIVMLHGAYQSARSWETTSDGREGFQTIFLRRGFPVYLVDQPRSRAAVARATALSQRRSNLRISISFSSINSVSASGRTTLTTSSLTASRKR